MKKKTLKIDGFELAAAGGAAVIAEPVRPAVFPSPAQDVARRVTAHWKIVALTAVATALIAWMFTALQPKRYRASAIAAVTPIVDGLAATEVLRGVDTLERRTLIATIAALASTPVIHRQALGTALDADEYAIEAVVLPNTNLLRVNVEGTDARRVAAVANRVPELISAQTRAMYRFYRVTAVSAATAPTAAAFPRVGRTVAAGLLVGAILGAIIAYTVDRRRTAVAR